MMVVTATIRHRQEIKDKAAIMVISLSAISVIFITVARATEENVKGVEKEVILRRNVDTGSG